MSADVEKTQDDTVVSRRFVDTSIEKARRDLAERITAMTPKTSPAATDIVRILEAIQGVPNSVHIESPRSDSGGYNSGSSGWSIHIDYAYVENSAEAAS